MRAFAAVFAREVSARRLVFPVALVAGFMPIVGSLAYGWSKPDAAEGRVLVALVAATAFSFAFALLFGGTVIAGETSEKRISFFFSRPLSAAAIWSGKVLAVLVLTFVPAVLVLVPAFATSTPRARLDVFRLGGTPGAVFSLFFMTLFVIFGAHAAVTMARLRSPWVALDLLLAPAVVLVAAASVASLARDRFFAAFRNGGSTDVSALFEGLAAVLLIALAAASYTQVAAGRTDARRAHGAFSVILWGILGTATAALGGFAWWAASAHATDLVSVQGGVVSAPRGPWATAGGPLGWGRGYGLFVCDATSGRSIRIRSGHAAFSTDGSRAAWEEGRFDLFERERKSDVILADLASARVVETGLECESGSCRVTLSPSGRKVALVDGRSVTAYDVSSPENPKQVAAFRLDGDVRGIAFLDEDRLRLFPRALGARPGLAPADLEIVEFSLSSRKPLVTGRFERDTLSTLRLTADGRYFVGTKRAMDEPYEERVLTLRDGRTGALVATLSDDLERPNPRFLTGGRIAVGGVAGGSGVLKIFLETERTPSRRVELGVASTVVLGGEVAPGRVAVGLNPFRSNDERSRRAWKLAFVDVASGVVSHGPDGLVPADRFLWWSAPVLPPAEAGSPASRLFLDASGALVRLDPETMKQEVLLGGRR